MGFLVEAYSKTCFTTSQYILITFVLDILMYLASLKLSHVFDMSIFLASFVLFWALVGHIFGPMGLFLGSRSGSKIFWNLLM